MAKQKLSIKNSVYQGGNGGYLGGLTVQNGRLINNRPCGKTGIAEMAEARAEAKRQAKIDMMAEGYALGEERAEMRKSILKDFFY